MSVPNGFFSSLFDFSFSEFLTTKIIKALYVVAVVLAALFALGMLVDAFKAHGAMEKLAKIVLAPIFFFFLVVGARIWLELLIVIFRIAEHVGQIARTRVP